MTTPASRSRRMSSSWGAMANEATLTRPAMIRSIRGRRRAVGPQVDPEWLVGAVLDRGQMAVPQLVQRHGRGGDDPEPARLRGGRHQPRARPPSPSRSARSGSRSRAGRSAGCASPPSSSLPPPAGVQRSRIRVSSWSDGGRVGVPGRGWPARSRSAPRRPRPRAGVHRPQPHPVVGRAEVEHGQVGHHEAELVEVGRIALAEPGGPAVADPGDHVDPGTNTRGECRGTQ